MSAITKGADAARAGERLHFDNFWRAKARPRISRLNCCRRDVTADKADVTFRPTNKYILGDIFRRLIDAANLEV